MKTRARKLSALLAASALALSLTACGGSSSAAPSELVIYDGQYSEMQLIHYMVKLLVEDQTDLTVSIKDQMAPVNGFNSVVSGDADLYNSYDGTLLTTFLHLDPADVPAGMSIYEFANQEGSAQKGVHLLDQLGLDNTYALAVPQTYAAEHGLETVSDLVPLSSQLTFGAEHDFFTVEGSMKYGPFTEFYGLEFKETVPVDISLKYSAIENGSFDATVVYTTDGLNRKADLKVLEDDRSFFPDYNGALMVRDDIFEKFAESAPNLEEVLAQLGGIFTNDIMTDLTYEVDVNGRSVAEVSQEFLTNQGLL